MKARDLMTARPHVVTGNDPVSRAARIMRDHNVGIVPVVDDLARLHLRGVITDRDIAVRCVAERHHRHCLVEDHMTSAHLDTVLTDAEVDTVITKMITDQLRRIMVTEGGRLIGIISQADLALKIGPRQPLRVEEVLERVSSSTSVTR